MAGKKGIEIVFQKFINNTLSKEEYEVLMEYIEDANNKQQWEALMKSHLFSDKKSNNRKENNNNDHTTAQYQEIISRLEGDSGSKFSRVTTSLGNKRKRPMGLFYGIAASLIVIVGLFFAYQRDIITPDTEISTIIETVDSDAIVLKQANGQVKVVQENQEEQIVDAKGNIIGTQKGNQLNYKTNTNGVMEKLVYNELTVPYGKRFDLVLSDGTLVKLNAGTSLKYPVQFIEGEKRKVFLKGEAYFDVAKDEAHPFVVNANEVNVQVLGTEFNMSFYPEDTDLKTVLVEGSVHLYEQEKGYDQASVIPLSPGHMASWNKENREMSVEKVDIELYTAWKDGILLFKRTPFNSIRKKLERHFDITIENQNGFLENQVYTASFMEESIEEILDAFKEDTPFGYASENDKIILLNTNQTN